MGKKTSGALSGAASGAAMGSALGPIGTGVGAVLGGLSGFLTGSGQDKAEKQAYERAQAEERQGRTNAFTSFLNQQGGRKEQSSRLNDMITMGRFLGAFGGREKAPPSLLKWFENMRTFQPQFVYEGPSAQRPIDEPFDYTGLMNDVASAYVGARSTQRGRPSTGSSVPSPAGSFTAAPIELPGSFGRRPGGFLGG